MSSTRFKTVFYPLIVLLFAVAAGLGGCKKETTLTTGGEVGFSTDTLTFDTVFTAQGSFTCSLRIYNPQEDRILISSIRMKTGAASQFKINVDGIPGDASNSIANLSIEGRDSAFIFATVTVNPNAENTPFVIEDELLATLNGKTFSIPAIAYGQNAYYIFDSVLKTDVWKTDKPYIIIRNALVDKNETLTIPGGARIYMHADSRLYVDGTLNVIGNKDDSVVFQGDRLDRAYFGYTGYPGEWGGLYFTQNSRNSALHYTILKNCGASTRIGDGVAQPAAIQVDSSAVVSLDRCIIENSIGYGILSFTGNITAENCLVSQTGAQGLALLQGGTYSFVNCTFSTFGSNKINHSENSIAAFQNFFKINDVFAVTAPLNVLMKNCIVWGGLETEFFVNAISGVPSNVTLTNCIVKRKDPLDATINATNTSTNLDPLFVDAGKLNFRLKDNSPARDAGAAHPFLLPGLPGAPSLSDLDGRNRTNGPIDLGAYEIQ